MHVIDCMKKQVIRKEITIITLLLHLGKLLYCDAMCNKVSTCFCELARFGFVIVFMSYLPTKNCVVLSSIAMHCSLLYISR